MIGSSDHRVIEVQTPLTVDDPTSIMNGWRDKSAGCFFVSKDLSSVQGRLGSLDGAAITRTTTSGAERREVNLGSAGEYARFYDVVHDDAAGSAGYGQGMARQRAYVPPTLGRV
jgi:hypothetical protein